MALALSSTYSAPAPSFKTLRAALLLLALAGCSEGENDDDGKLTTGPAGTSASDESSSGSGAPTTTEVGSGTSGTGSTGDEPTGSSTAAVGTTTTGDETTSGTTGPICDPGQGNCVCDNGTCVDGFVCELDVCVPGPMVCPGDLEPGDDAEETATDNGDITDNDSQGFTVSGVLSGAADADWYTYHGADTFGYVAEPTLTLNEGAMRVCQFLVCDNGGAALTEVNCPAGSKLALSPMLRPGCCGETSIKISDFNCSGQDESATIWIRVDKPTVDECTNYSFKLNF
jgi:hypothetical protein